MRISWGGILRIVGAILLGFAAMAALAQPPAPLQHRSQTDPNLDANILLGAARNAVLRGDMPAAIARFQEFRRKYPDREDGRREYADALFRAGRVEEAMPEYEWLLARRPNDPKLIRTMVDAMLNAGSHPQAKRLLTDAVAKFPDRIDFAVSLALLHALDDETTEAEELIRSRIAGHTLPDRRTQLDAAALYVQLKNVAKAGPLIDRLLKTDPDDAKVLALSVRYGLLIGDRRMAVERADKLDRLYPGNIDLRLELASALYAAGEYAEAGRFFADVLEKSPNNATALIGCARTAMQDYRIELADGFLERVPDDLRGRQWQLAVAERDTIVGGYYRGQTLLRRLLAEDSGDRQASIALADLDRAENEFVKADARYLAENAESDNPVAARHFALSLYLQRRYCDAERICRNLLAHDPENSEVRVLLARVLLRAHRTAEALELASGPQMAEDTVFPERSYLATFVSEDFRPRHVDETRPIRTAATMFDLAMEDGRRDWAKQVLDAAMRTAPNNVILRTRLAEWHASFGVPCEAACAARIYEGLLSQDPSNQKWLLGLARANVTMRCNDEALALYRKLRCESPDNYLYARENARVVFFVCGSPKGLAEYDSAICHWTGNEEEACRLTKERAAKAAHFSSPSVASHLYEELLTLEPYEQHLAFELGQAQGTLGNTTNAIDAYAGLLENNPNHRDGAVALEGKQLERCQRLTTDTRFVRERGRDGMTSIDRFGQYVGYQFPRTDENEHLAFGYGRLSLSPTYGSGTEGDAVTFKYRKQLHADLGPWLSSYVPMALFVDGEVQRYDHWVSTRPVMVAGVEFETYKDLIWTIAGTTDNVLENGEALQQDIYRGGVRTGLNYKPCNWWECGALYEFQEYSDDNSRHAAEFRSRLQLTPDPRRLSLVGDLYYWNFAQASVFSPGPDPFNNMIHPYWTPQDYWMGGVGLEWKQWLSWDRFNGAQHCWVAFSAMKRWDNQNQNYTIYRGTMNWDITRCLSGYAMAEYDDGAPYRGTWVYGGLAWKF